MEPHRARIPFFGQMARFFSIQRLAHNVSGLFWRLFRILQVAGGIHDQVFFRPQSAPVFNPNICAHVVDPGSLTGRPPHRLFRPLIAHTTESLADGCRGHQSPQATATAFVSCVFGRCFSSGPETTHSNSPSSCRKIHPACPIFTLLCTVPSLAVGPLGRKLL